MEALSEDNLEKHDKSSMNKMIGQKEKSDKGANVVIENEKAVPLKK